MSNMEEIIVQMKKNLSSPLYEHNHREFISYGNWNTKLKKSGCNAFPMTMPEIIKTVMTIKTGS